MPELQVATALPAALAKSETQGLWLPFKLGAATTSTTFGDGDASYDAGETITDCAPTHLLWKAGKATGVNATTNAANNVIREGPALSNGTTANDYGNIRLAPNAWPFIQMLDFSADGNVDIVYNRAGADETVTLVYTDGAQGLSFDKDIYGLHHEVGVTLTDWNLNIDPTDEDTWTFATLPTNSSAFYQMFDENGNDDTAGEEATSPGTAGNSYAWSSDVGTIAPAGLLSIDRNGDTTTDSATTNAVISFQDNADWPCVAASSGLCSINHVNAADQPVTFTEAGANTGVFINWDETLKTNMVIETGAPRGTQAVFSYDGDEYGVMNQPTFATIAFDTSGIGAEWNCWRTCQP